MRALTQVDDFHAVAVILIRAPDGHNGKLRAHQPASRMHIESQVCKSLGWRRLEWSGIERRGIRGDETFLVRPLELRDIGQVGVSRGGKLVTKKSGERRANVMEISRSRGILGEEAPP